MAQFADNWTDFSASGAPVFAVLDGAGTVSGAMAFAGDNRPQWNTYVMTDSATVSFFDLFDLYDKGIDAIEFAGGEVRILFSLFHCDDPERDDEGIEYLLTAVFRDADVRVLDGNVPFGETQMGGEVLALDRKDGAVVFGIEWRDYISQLMTWSTIAVTAEPLRFEEKVTPISPEEESP